MLKLSIAWFAVVLIAALAVVTAAKASYGDPRLDQVASAIAGHPVSVSCGANSIEWASTEQAAGNTGDTDGYTFVGRTPAVIYLAPRICDTLEADLHEGPAAVGDYWNGLAIKVLIHESEHQAGHTNESETECAALPLVKTWALSFGYSRFVVVASYKRLPSGLYKKVVKSVPNPALARVQAWAQVWHRRLPASYQVGC